MLPRVQYKCAFPESAEDVEYDELFFSELGAESKAYSPEKVYLDAVNGSSVLGVAEAKRLSYEKYA